MSPRYFSDDWLFTLRVGLAPVHRRRDAPPGRTFVQHRGSEALLDSTSPAGSPRRTELLPRLWLRPAPRALRVARS
eukprot:8118411-Alexandrium_andersonii.AAC.1